MIHVNLDCMKTSWN